METSCCRLFRAYLGQDQEYFPADSSSIVALTPLCLATIGIQTWESFRKYLFVYPSPR